ncbi:5' nucleotidase, NT5C type [Alkalicoccobacillus porphyridii]|uniref:5'-3'-deoxyribonucleotidase n=1 Tax=Alkalicoccobacillus porphyridii TaxID=2597270 RepID=A0A553ZX71_9BACI|nr:5'-3'-deoxyribonucleotidase [Alkalicoccobacillus porphyridii]TSB46034.1 5'-3'-deoxyribonucleotidase [Alkalicoccobacillus porphyridii]
MKKRIAIDMDEVIADFIPKHLDRYNQEYNEQLTVNDLQGCTLESLRPDLEDVIKGYIREPNFFRDLKVIKDSQSVIEELSFLYEVYITTAAMEYPTSFTAKYEWLKEHFPFLSDMNFVFCGTKKIIRADYLIDDNTKHFKTFEGQGLLYTAPHNVHETGYVRVNNWQEIKSFFSKEDK